MPDETKKTVDSETKKTDDSAAAGTVAATEEGAVVEEEDTGDASISSDEEVVAEGTTDSEVIPVEDGTQQGTIEDGSSADDASVSTGSEAIVVGDSEGDDDTGESSDDSDTEPEGLPVPEAPEEADFPEIVDLGDDEGTPVSTGRAFDPRSAFIRDNVSIPDPLKGSGRPTEDEEQELLEVRRGTLEPPDISFGAGAGADAAPRVSAPLPTQSPRDILPMSTGIPRLQEDPTEVWIGDTGIDGPTEVPIGGEEDEGDTDDGGMPPEPEPPPAEEPPPPPEMEPPDLPGPGVAGDDADAGETAFAADRFPTFGAGSGVASTEPGVSEESLSGVEPSRFDLVREGPDVETVQFTGEDEPHEIQIDSTEDFGEPTEFSIDGTPLESPPPPAEEPPDPDA